MIASEILIVLSGLITLSTTIAGSTACAYFCSRNGNTSIAELIDKQKTLWILINDLQQKLVTLTGVAVVTPDPSPWMEKAKDFLTALNVTNHVERLDSKCMYGLLPNCAVQRGARMSIEGKLLELNGLTEEGQRVKRELTVRGFKNLHEVTIVGNSRTETKEEIWRLVSAKNGVGTVCIHGPFGVGKTAIAVSIHNKALQDEHQLFDSVIWVSVEDGAGLRQVQEGIARSLNSDLSDFPITGDATERARRLNEALLKKGNFLLVLDSMWQEFSLKDIGIPEPVDGRKLIVTSRIRTVCMSIGRAKTFEVKPLIEDDAWELFKNEMGSSLSNLHADTLNITETTVAELDGLPLAIHRLAHMLGNIQEQNPDDFDHAWRKELLYLAGKPTYLENRDQELFHRFKESYNNLKEDTSQCLLYCSLFPKDHLIDSRELIEYWMWEGLVGDFNIHTLEKGREEGRDAIIQLKNAHLLQSVTGELGSDEKVKMLKVVRSMAVHTMVEDGKQVCIRSGGSLTSLPPSGHDWNSKVERASFMKNQLKALQLKEGLNCGQLSTLLLQDNPLDSNSHVKFFNTMNNLKVLDLSRTKISTLPKSLSNLTNLQALLLRKCTELTKLPKLSKLNQLIVLDLLGTPLVHCPEGIQEMKKLRRLNLSQTKLATFPAKVVGQLSDLEELLMITDHNCVWGSINDEQWEGACIEELVKLGKLAVLQLHFVNAGVFYMYINMAEVHTNVPPKFRFRVGQVQTGGYIERNSLAISGIGSSTPPNRTSSLDMKSLLKLTEISVLDVSNFSGFQYHQLFSVEILGSLIQLRELRVRGCEEIGEVAQQPAAEDTIPLPKLTKLLLFELGRLKSLCRGKTLNCPSLRSVEVWRCENLKLPMILSDSGSPENYKPRMEIHIRGERNWLKELEWDNFPASSNPDFKGRPHLNCNFSFVEAPVPPELAAGTASARQMMQEGSSWIANGIQKKDQSVLSVILLYLAGAGMAGKKNSLLH